MDIPEDSSRRGRHRSSTERFESVRSDASISTYVSIDQADVTSIDGEETTEVPAARRRIRLRGANTSKQRGLSAATSRVVYLNAPGKNAAYCDNTVVTAKYSLLNFVPRFLHDRLTQVANFYFLLVGLGQVIPEISSTGGIPYQWIVLLMVLSIDALFAAIEDNARHQADRKVNARLTQLFEPNAGLSTPFREIFWRDVRVGSILKVCNYDPVPADLLLIAVAEPDPTAPTGICFVETKSLDGETNLKVRQALSCTFGQLSNPHSLSNLPGRVICELPNHDINKFSGRYEPHRGHTIPVDLKNVIFRGSVVRNTAFIYGLVLNTGRDTKITQSSTEMPTKQSKILAIVNHGVGVLLAILFVLCVLGAIICSVWVATYNSTATYLLLGDPRGEAPFRNDLLGWFIYLGYYWILIASFVPITLYVTIAIVKNYQTYFLTQDIHIYDEVTDTRTLVRNADLNDDLGQVTHIFSDKTGTLTANEMNFRKMSVNGISYGRGTTEIGRDAIQRLGQKLSVRDLLADDAEEEDVRVDNVRFLDPTGDFYLDANGEKDSVQADKIHAFLTHLAVCHSVVVEQVIDGAEPTFSASSPDELALVSGANYFGYSFVARKSGAIVVRMPPSRGRGVHEFELLEVIEFTSARKRMSVVVRTPDKKVMVLTKGADTAIFPRIDLAKGDASLLETTQDDLERYATEGLRTLVIAQKEISNETFITWLKRYRQAVAALQGQPRHREELETKVEELEEELESGLELLGATAIEDRLQDKVSNTIGDLARAGVRLWVLTGDKEETAVNIAFACRLLDNDMERLAITGDRFPTHFSLFEMLVQQCIIARMRRQDRQKTNQQHRMSLIVDGQSLSMIFACTALRDFFLEVSQQCSTVICCRVSPKQKAQVVRLYKTSVRGCRTLAIGDGANDVGMIQEAHIGVGISGHEGMQAVNSSDFAIAQFRFLKRLLLVHGRWNYRRMAKLTLYIVYKNIVLYMAEYVFGLLSGGSGTLYYNNMWINGYNVLWTSVPIAVVAVSDQDVPARIAEQFPSLYSFGLRGEQFNLVIFTEWILEAMYEASVCAFVPALLGGYIDSQGYGYSREICGGISYCAMISVGWVKLALNTVTWNFVTVLSMFGSLLVWYLSAWVTSVMLPISISDTVFPYLFCLPEFYILMYLCLLLCLGRDFVYKAYKREFEPEYYHILQELHCKRSDPELAKWEAPSLELEPFEADLTQDPRDFEFGTDEEDVVLTPSKAKALQKAHAVESGEAYTGFAFSTAALDDRFLSPIRDLIIPVTLSMQKIGGVLSTRDLSNRPSSPTPSREPSASLSSFSSFESKVRELPMDEQVVYEIQRYQVFSGWGSTVPGHLLVTDPPRFTDADMTDGTACFDLSDWAIDREFGTTDQWQYATRMKDFLHLQDTNRLLSKDRRRLKKRLSKLVGRSVRRRRWVRKELVQVEDSIPEEANN